MYHTILSTEQISAIIRMAWEDRTSFEEILSRTGLSDKNYAKRAQT